MIRLVIHFSNGERYAMPGYEGRWGALWRDYPDDYWPRIPQEGERVDAGGSLLKVEQVNFIGQGRMELHIREEYSLGWVEHLLDEGFNPGNYVQTVEGQTEEAQ